MNDFDVAKSSAKSAVEAIEDGRIKDAISLLRSAITLCGGACENQKPKPTTYIPEWFIRLPIRFDAVMAFNAGVELGCGKQTVRKRLQLMVAAGVIAIISPHSGRSATEYRKVL